jgi:hypothetical protein
MPLDPELLFQFPATALLLANKADANKQTKNIPKPLFIMILIS